MSTTGCRVGSRSTSQPSARSAAAAAAAQLLEREIAVDGESVLFAHVERDGSWTSVAHLDEHTIAIAGSGVVPPRLQLHAIPDR
jgi:hypothetical protein